MTTDASTIVELAVQAAGPQGSDARAWRRKVYTLIPEIGILLRDGSEAVTLATNVLGCTQYNGQFVGFEEEFIPDSKPPRVSRLIFTTQNDKSINLDKRSDNYNPTGEEHIRTEPVWTMAGRLVAERIRNLEPGTPLLVYKYTEQISASKKVRVCPHFEVIGRPPANQERQQQPAPQPPEEIPGSAADQAPAREPQAPPEPHSPADNRALSEIESRFDKLSAKKKIAFGHLCKDAGITTFMAPEPEDLERVLGFLTHVEET